MQLSSLRIIVTGLIGQHPLLGGMTWHYLQYLIGLARLGHDVYYFEDSGEWPYNLDGGVAGDDWISYDCIENVAYLDWVMSRFGLDKRWAYRFPISGEWFGLSDIERTQILKTADMLLNVSGSLESPGHYRQIVKLVYIDTDPIFTQVKLARGEEDFRARVDLHDLHFSYGEFLRDPSLETGHNWRPTRQPIVLTEWRPSNLQRNAFTTIMSWTSYKPLAYAGKTYGQKDLEFYRFLHLPRKVQAIPLEVALSHIEHMNWGSDMESISSAALELMGDEAEWSSRELLIRSGWDVVDATKACRDIDSYRSYIASSRAEWSVAKNGYVQGQPGWFSERSACYLASGRPVIVQDTGINGVLPVGCGIVTFKCLDEAANAVREVDRDYARHSSAAREICEAYFASDQVLTGLIDASIANDSQVNMRL